jgi:hypothetical protein
MEWAKQPGGKECVSPRMRALSRSEMAGGVYYQSRGPENYAATEIDEDDDEAIDESPRASRCDAHSDDTNKSSEGQQPSGRIRDKERELDKLKAETEMLRRRLQSYRTGAVEEIPDEFVGSSPVIIPGPEKLFSKVSGLYNSSFSGDSSFSLQRAKSPTMYVCSRTSSPLLPYLTSVNVRSCHFCFLCVAEC